MNSLLKSRQKLTANLLLATLITAGGYSQTIMPANAAQTASKTTSTSVGTNLSGISYWSTQQPFLDAFKSANTWITQSADTWNTQEDKKLNLDANGWVKSLPAKGSGSKYTQVGTLLFRGMKNQYPGGKYIVLYEGEGTLKYSFDAQKVDTESKPGRDVLNVDPAKGGGVYLAITSTNPKNYIRNIRVVPAQYEAQLKQGQVFNPAFLNKTKNFTTLRFMDWMQTNDSQQSQWQNRPTPQMATYSTKGAPVEIMVALSNQLKADAWFNMPHMATDDYVSKFAQTVKSQLGANQKVYVEYSNEVWNSQFEQSKWVGEQGKKEFKTGGSDYAKLLNWHGKRTAQICDSWKRAFGNQSNRVVCVLGAQAANLDTATQGLTTPLWKQRPAAKIDAVAIAPYFGGYLGAPNTQAQVQSWSQDQLFQELTKGGLLPGGPAGGAIAQATKFMTDYAAFTKQNNVQLIAYEGGQHLVGRGGAENNQKLTDLLIAANRDPRMSQLYSTYLNTWKKSGGGLFMNFSDIAAPSKWGSWGTLEYVDQKTSPKYSAVMDFIQKNR